MAGLPLEQTIYKHMLAQDYRPFFRGPSLSSLVSRWNDIDHIDAPLISLWHNINLSNIRVHNRHRRLFLQKS